MSCERELGIAFNLLAKKESFVNSLRAEIPSGIETSWLCSIVNSSRVVKDTTKNK